MVEDVALSWFDTLSVFVYFLAVYWITIKVSKHQQDAIRQDNQASDAYFLAERSGRLGMR